MNALLADNRINSYNPELHHVIVKEAVLYCVQNLHFVHVHFKRVLYQNFCINIDSVDFSFKIVLVQTYLKSEMLFNCKSKYCCNNVDKCLVCFLIFEVFSAPRCCRMFTALWHCFVLLFSLLFNTSPKLTGIYYGAFSLM